MKFFRSRIGIALVLALLIFALFLIRPGAGRLKGRIVSSISRALGSQVEVTSVTFQLLPRPGFELDNFVVYDDPAFGAEPMLRAGEVTAALRVTSLLRGRLEISKLNLSEPSLNLVRNGDGHWNLETLLERAAKMPIAPTGKFKSEKRPAFPYIQADRGRINFKVGAEKKPYAMSDADFGLWQDSENSWGMRLKAQPVRTDLNLTDTGLLTINGSWQRAATLRETPVKFALSWEHAQLGQATKFIRGSDAGWRGKITVSAMVSGTPADLTVEASPSVQDFRRYDIVVADPIVLAAHCSGHYSSTDQILSNIDCRAPIGQGAIAVAGNVSGISSFLVYNLALKARDVPTQSLLGLARHAKSNLPDDLLATGNLNAKIDVRRDGSKTMWGGGGETSQFHLRSSRTSAELILDKIPFSIFSGGSPKLGTRSKRGLSTVPASEAHVEVGPFNVALGRPSPAVVHGSFSRSGYSLSIVGDVQFQRLLQLARNIGVPSAQPSADGPARVDLQLAGNWQGFSLPKPNGTIQLRTVRAEVRGLESPLSIESANLILTQDQVNVQHINASLAGSAWQGTLILPRQCETPGTCPIRFDLHADEISTDRLNQLFDPKSHRRSWYQLLSSSGTPYALTLFATGQLTANRVAIHKLAGTHLSARVELNHGKLVISDLRANMLGGRHSGNWTADFTTKPPTYSGSGTLQQVALEDLAALMHDGWVAGTASATYQTSTSGTNLTQLLASATATVDVDASTALLPHITLETASEPLRINHFLGTLNLLDGDIDFKESKAEIAGNVYQINGTANLGQKLNLRLEREGSTGFEITGTVTEPRISTTTTREAEAALKP